MFNVAVDTSIIIAHLRDISDHFTQLEELNALGKLHLLIPHIVITELYVGKEAKNKAGKKAIDASYKGIEIVGFTVSSAKLAGELIRTYPQIPDPFDLIIAAIAIEQEAQIATHNEKHFKQIRGVRLFNFQEK